MESVLAELGVEASSSDYGVEVQRTVRIAPEAVPRFHQRITEATAGRARVAPGHSSSGSTD